MVLKRLTSGVDGSNFVRFFDNMGKRRFHHIPLFSTRATATVSVSLVLVVLGIAAMVGVVTHRLTVSVMDNMGFVVIFNEDVTAGDIARITDGLKRVDAVASTVYSSPDDILARWQKMVGEDEDILSLAGVNPFTPELEVRVKPDYASPDSIAVLSAPIVLMPQVADVKVQNELIEIVSSTMRSVSLTLVGIAVALLLVSFVLISNTVRLTVYSRRFMINTMQLVGATPAFVRRPFLVEGVVSGAVAGVLASVIVGLLIYATRHLDTSVSSLIDWSHVMMVMGGMVVTGVVICFVASAFACNRYLALTHDQLYRQ